MIDGYRTVYDVGPLANPLNQPDLAQTRRANQDNGAPAVSRVEKTDASRQAGVDTPQPVPTKPESRETSSASPGDTKSARDPGMDQSQTGQSSTAMAESEPKLPKLSAEALATALMHAEPDKALVPRVLPAGWNENNYSS